MKKLLPISTSTQLCGIIGNPVGHSLSPAIHNRAFDELGLDFVYLAFKVENVEAAINGMRALDNFKGLSVTIPHKVEVIRHLDEIAEVDQHIGSINTVVKEGNTLKGLGSDGPGARQALIDGNADPTGQPVVLLGSGGAARAIAFDLAINAPPSSLIIGGIIEEELNVLVQEVSEKSSIDVRGHLLGNQSLESALDGARVLVHATPIGMHPHVEKSIVDPAFMGPDLAVMDIVYNPLETKLLRDAREKGLKTISGVDMFVNQAVIQFESWTGKKAPVEIMKQVVLDNL